MKINLKKIADDIRGRSVTCLDDLSLTRAQIKRVLLIQATEDQSLWPFNSLKAHRYALRMMRLYENANGEYSDFEFLAGYEECLSRYVNDPKNQ